MEDHKPDDPDCPCDFCEHIRHILSQPVGLFYNGAWLGHDTEALVYTDPTLAEIAARTIALQLGVRREQIEILPFDGANMKVGEERTFMSGDKALDIVCGMEEK